MVGGWGAIDPFGDAEEGEEANKPDRGTRAPAQPSYVSGAEVASCSMALL